MPFIDVKIVIIALAVLVLAFLILRYRSKTAIPLAVAFSIAALWSFYFRYEYTDANVFLFNRINLYPLILWTTGLTLLQLVSYHLPRKHRVILASIFYVIFLLIAEAIGYHLLNVRLESEYTSLLNLGVIHAPTIMKIFYIAAGPAYLLLLNFLSRKRAL